MVTAGKIFHMAAGDVRDSCSLICGVNFSHRKPVHRWLDGVRDDCSLIMAAQILSAETCSPMGCGICHSIKRASKRRGGKSRESHTLGQTGEAPCPLAASTATPKPRVESSNLSAPATKIPDFNGNREFSLSFRIIHDSTRSSRSIKLSIPCRPF